MHLINTLTTVMLNGGDLNIQSRGSFAKFCIFIQIIQFVGNCEGRRNKANQLQNLEHLLKSEVLRECLHSLVSVIPCSVVKLDCFRRTQEWVVSRPGFATGYVLLCDLLILQRRRRASSSSLFPSGLSRIHSVAKKRDSCIFLDFKLLFFKRIVI